MTQFAGSAGLVSASAHSLIPGQVHIGQSLLHVWGLQSHSCTCFVPLPPTCAVRHSCAMCIIMLYMYAKCMRNVYAKNVCTKIYAQNPYMCAKCSAMHVCRIFCMHTHYIVRGRYLSRFVPRVEGRLWSQAVDPCEPISV